MVGEAYGAQKPDGYVIDSPVIGDGALWLALPFMSLRREFQAIIVLTSCLGSLRPGINEVSSRS
jgi:hypothetical protein